MQQGTLKNVGCELLCYRFCSNVDTPKPDSSDKSRIIRILRVQIWISSVHLYPTVTLNPKP